MSEISSVLKESRLFKPSTDFAKRAHFHNPSAYKKLRAQAEKRPDKFWADQAKHLYWQKPFKKALEWKFPFAKWFIGGKINAAENCLDVHLGSERQNKAAIIWEGEPGDARTLTYLQLSLEVNKLANGLKSLGVKKGDVVGVYMGMIPEAVISMLACARIGATHNVVFGGFSGEALRDRLNNSKAKVLLTQDGAFRRGSASALKGNVHSILDQIPTLEKAVVLKRTNQDTPMKDGRDIWWSDLVGKQSDSCKAEALDSEHPLFILYTSGSTGKPKGILHTTGGYLTQVKYTTHYTFDLRDEDIYFCTADIGWVTGHSYVTYGPLMNGATVFMYEGAPNYPGPDRFWSLIAKHKISIFYTAPTAIRAFMRSGDDLPRKHDLTSLRLLGSVGEPINPEAWMWYHDVIGGKHCPIVDTWWQTETGAIMVTPMPGVVPTKPGTATLPIPGILADVVDRNGKSCKANEGGLLVVKHPWPAMLRTVFGDKERYTKTYWADFKKNKFYFSGDGARKDKDGYIWIMGRVDDVVNVSGHRLGTAEVESAIVSNHKVAEAAVVARPDELKGSALVAFVTLKAGAKAGNPDLDALKTELKNWVAKEIGPIAKPDDIRFADALPKTRSGKIMRRLLREMVTTGKTSGDTSTLEDFSVLEKLRQDEE
ncbi:MAG: acetate--CoA ligase [Bdellovibrionales bacterium]|nr:acetate--CoA ligase [Bdellovibrionales bacterium]